MRRPHLWLLVLAIPLGGCVQVTEEFWIHDDLSARATFGFGIAEVALQQAALRGRDPLGDVRAGYASIKARLDADPNVTRCSIAEQTDGATHWITLDTELRSILAWNAQHAAVFGDALAHATPADAPYLASVATWEMRLRENGNVYFRQVLRVERNAEAPDSQAPPPLPDEVQDALHGVAEQELGRRFAEAIAEAAAPPMRVTVTVHGPRIAAANGTLSDDDTSVTWSMPAGAIAATRGGPQRDLRVEVAVPAQGSPLTVILGGTAILVVLAGGAGGAAIVLRRRRIPAPRAEARRRPVDAAPTEPSGATVRITCPTCALEGKVLAEKAGTRVTCKRCGEQVRVPPAGGG